MERNETPPPGFDAEDYARVERAAHLVGKDPLTFVRDAALAAAEDPFLKALEHAADTVERLATVFDSADTGVSAVRTVRGQVWPDVPLGSSDLHDQQHGHAA
ncbi:hypothetical protein [Streptomyces subrutilus]|uniref:Uncharacterized protein n=1 Tax=Streptomyces subrutilus TaxID=36818 RepID=A0A1E5NXT7_9ACTN|nr:hypothetical protein [Streptomyces subrutilus]OEJ21064.1 hypothetical protein BGK67_34795 [Streptomyces subrutilus]